MGDAYTAPSMRAPCAHQLPWKKTSMSTHHVPPFQHQHRLYQAKYAEQRSPYLTLQHLVDPQNACMADEKSRGQRRSVLVNCRKQRRRQHVDRNRRASICRNKMNSHVVTAKSKIFSHFFSPRNQCPHPQASSESLLNKSPRKKEAPLTCWQHA